MNKHKISAEEMRKAVKTLEENQQTCVVCQKRPIAWLMIIPAEPFEKSTPLCDPIPVCEDHSNCKNLKIKLLSDPGYGELVRS